MSLELKNFQDPTLDAEYITWLLEKQAPENEARLGRFWNYYRNALLPASGASADALNEHSRPYFLAQEVGLPSRITGIQRSGQSRLPVRRKEVVIENDIAWRINTMVDYLFGGGVTLRSTVADPQLAGAIDRVLSSLLEANGGALLLQEAGLYASVYGHVDFVLRIPSDWPASLASAIAPGAGATGASSLGPANSSAPTGTSPNGPKPSAADEAATRGDRSRFNLNTLEHLARRLRIETVEAPRVLPILAEDDAKTSRYWIQRYYKHPSRMASPQRNWMGRVRRESASPDVVEVVDILSANFWQRYEDRRLVSQGPNVLGYMPVVHVQNLPSPGSYAGLSDVEPMIPLQDELNTRLSDRAHRVTYQAFKMYLGKGIDEFLDRPVGPGQMWATNNLNASIEAVGSDDGSPSEDIHIEQVRRAMDKTSGVAPIATGLLEGNLGNLSSATALKVVLSGLLKKTARKQLTFAQGFKQLAWMTLDILNRSGALKTTPQQRRVDVLWPDMLPTSETDLLRNAQLKQNLGVPQDRLLAELGYDADALSSRDD